jgi:hypothetical protein
MTTGNHWGVCEFAVAEVEVNLAMGRVVASDEDADLSQGNLSLLLGTVAEDENGFIGGESLLSGDGIESKSIHGLGFPVVKGLSKPAG